MKKIYNYIAFLASLLLLTTSCSNTIEKIYVDSNESATPSVLTINGSSNIAPTEDNINSFPLIFNWTKTLLGSTLIPVEYTIQVSDNDEFQSSLQESVGTNLLSTSFTNGEFNKWGLKFQNNPEEFNPIDLFVRVAATVKSNNTGLIVPLDSIYSNYVIINITPSDITPMWPEVLYVPGNHQGWDPASAPQLKLVDEVNGIFEGFVCLDGGFKVTNAPNWDGIGYGAGSAPGELSTDGGADNLEAPEGCYKLVVNLSTLTYELLEELPVLYVPGNHQGWSPDSAPTISSPNFDNIYTGNVALDGEFKFTSAPNWDGINYGQGAAAGTLSIDDDAGNLSAPAGTYNIEVDLNNLTYTLTPAS